MWNGLPIVIFGTGGISKESLHIVEQINNANNCNVFNFLGFVENEEEKVGEEITKNHRIISCDSRFQEFASNYKLVGVIIPQGTPKIKKIIYNKLNSIENIVFPNIIHPNVIFDKQTVKLGEGNIIASGAKLTNDINIGNFNLINLNCTIGHDVKIGDFNVINPLASISGHINIEECCLVGTGANILQNLKLENECIVGAGSVVTKDVKSKDIVIGSPARKLNNR